MTMLRTGNPLIDKACRIALGDLCGTIMPGEISSLYITDLHFREAVLDIDIETGVPEPYININGTEVPKASIPAKVSGAQHIRIGI